ncbi:MAG: glycolate oxidase subunit GlcF [Rhodocyclaceae bacterium]
MQTLLADFIRDTEAGQEADEILRRCVHCGFCLATCPTYQLLGDERDSPRGRIYLIKQLLEGQPATAAMQTHLDRCLTCRACETTCPSGVRYGRLVDIGRAVLAEHGPPRPLAARATRWVLRHTLPHRAVFHSAAAVGRLARPALPRALASKLPPAVSTPAVAAGRHARRVLALAGCVQGELAPQINAAAARVLDALGVSMVEQPAAGCCGAMRFHLDDQAGGRRDAAALVAQWYPWLASGEIEAAVMTASGCGAFVREYGHVLGQEHEGAAATTVADRTLDLSEFVARELDVLRGRVQPAAAAVTLAWQSPCTLQHGQKITGVVERILAAVGYRLTAVPDAHLCCGSAGTYSILQPAIAGRLREAKLQALQGQGAQGIASANIGCITHLAGTARVPVRHWVEWVADRLLPAA